MSRSALNYDRDELSIRSGIIFEDPSRTIQSERDSADINTIVRQFGLTGKLPEGVRIPTYEDWSDAVNDYQTAVEALREAQNNFLALPASLRSRFHNDPQAFLEYCTNEANLPEMRSLGLAVSRETGSELSPPSDGGKKKKPGASAPGSADPDEG